MNQLTYAIGHLILILFLTVISQIGGLFYLIMLCIIKWKGKQWKPMKKVCLGLVSYLLFIAFLLPPLAKWKGRKPLPVFGDSLIKPSAAYLYILNRHYVKVRLYDYLLAVEQKMAAKKNPKTIYYLDAGFPFWDKFILFPHLSHGDGRKVDISFIYDHQEKKTQIRGNPSTVGYGYYEAPKKGESNMPNTCLKKNPYYGISEIFPKKWNTQYKINEKATSELIRLFANQKGLDKMLLEPHLKTRWRLQNIGSLRFQGCHAVRHDDHIHVQVH